MKVKMTWSLIGLVVVLLAGSAVAKQKVLFIDSYHMGYEWSDGIAEGICTTLGVKMDKEGKTDDSASSVEFKMIRMDTKNCSGAKVKENATADEIKAAQEEFKKGEALKAKELIDTWKPDAVIISDDNTVKYVLLPFFKDSSIPFVFCGVNWDASGYGLPCKNVTGMVEVILIQPLIKSMRDYAKGDRVAFLAPDNETTKKDAEGIMKGANIKMDCRYVMNFEQWKEQYKALQGEVDMLFLSIPGIKGYDEAAAKQFVLENTKIPSGCCQRGETEITLIGYVKLPQEQGSWAAETAKEILGGKSPADIPVVANKKGQMYLHFGLAKKLGVEFPLSMVKNAKVVKN